MKGNPSIRVNMLMNAILTMSSIVFPLVTLPYVTRVLGAEGVGKVYFASSVVAFLAIFTEIGIPVYGIRACAKVRDDHIELSRTAREILTVNLAACIAVYAVFALLLITIPRLAEDRLLMMIMSLTWILNAAGAEWLYKALEKYTYITVRSILFKLAALVMMFILVKSESDYIIYGLLTIFAASASNIVNMCNLHRYVDLRRPARIDIRRHLPGMMMLFALAAATTVYTNLDLTLLDFMKGDAEAGIYGVSVKIKLVIVSLVTSVSAVLLPRNSSYYEKGQREDFYRLIAGTLRMILTVSFPVALYFMIFARESILVLSGDGFIGAVAPMKVIMPSVVFIGVSNVVGMQMLVPEDREKEVVIAAAIGAAADLVLNVILIPGYGATGAAAATLAAEILVTTYLLRAIGRDAKELFRGYNAWRAAIWLALSCIAGCWVKLMTWSPVIKLIISALCYFGIYALLMLGNRRRNDILHRN